jgi:TRAP-type C4-dicarboxylate transport system permease large subunit
VAGAEGVALETSKITAIMMFILMMAQVFALAFRGLHGEDLIVRMFEWLPGGVNSDIWFMMALIFALGFFIECLQGRGALRRNTGRDLVLVFCYPKIAPWLPKAIGW